MNFEPTVPDPWLSLRYAMLGAVLFFAWGGRVLVRIFTDPSEK